MAETKIPYCDVTWDLTIGCQKRSPGCLNCWATRTVHRLACKPVRGYDFQTSGSEKMMGERGWDWLDTPEINLLDWNLDKPLHWRKGRFIFVNSKSDLFDERVPFPFIAQAFDTMALARQHHFMILTKEPQRMAEFLEWYSLEPSEGGYGGPTRLANLILMVSVEDTHHLERIETLVRIPAAHYGVSFEPLLEPVSDRIDRHLWRDRKEDDGLARYGQLLDWIVVGCEKLPGGRAGRWESRVPTPESWWAEAGAIVRHCRDAGIRTWIKQGPVRSAEMKWPIRVTEEIEDFPANCRIQEHPDWRPSL